MADDEAGPWLRRLARATGKKADIPSSLGDALYQTGRDALLYPFRNPGAAAELGLAIAPGSGEAMSATDSWNASGRAADALLTGDYGTAASEYGNVATGVLGAIPGAGIIARGTKRGAAWMDKNLPAGLNRLLDATMPSDPKNTTNTFAGPTAKTADHAALSQAQAMAASGVGRDAIHAQTGWHQGVDGKWRFEIDDSGASLAGLEKGKVARFSGIDHPELEQAYGRLAPVHGMVRPGAPEEGAFLPGGRNFPPYIHAQGRNPESAKSVALHEFQHGAQHVEGFATGGSPKSFALDLPSGGYDNGYDLYRRLAGEVEARNVQTRMNMTAAERRAKAPWLTQDVPDDLQIIRR
jgi:hypothetical protein